MEWQGVRKPTVIVEGAGGRKEFGGGWERWWVVYCFRR